MMTMMVISYIVTWTSIVYSLLIAPSEEELQGEEMY